MIAQNKEKAHEQHHIEIEKWLRELEQARNVESLLEQASQKAIRTGKQEDLATLLKLRREML